MESSSGHLKLNDTDINVREAQCTIFVGRLDIDVTSTVGDVSFLNIPFPSATDLSDLSGQTFSRDDCTKHNYENSIFQPVVSFRTDYFAVRFIKFEALNCENGNLLCAVDLRAVEPESEAELKIRGKIRAEFYRCASTQAILELFEYNAAIQTPARLMIDAVSLRKQKSHPFADGLNNFLDRTGKQ